jgi:autotransporter-associated beta strand protein
MPLPVRRSRLVRLALAAGAGMGVVAALSNSAVAQPYNWTNANGGNWSDPTSWAGGVSPVSASGTQILFNTDGNYTSNADVTPANGLFNLSNLTVAMPTSTSMVTLGILGTSVDTLNFVLDTSGNAPQLLVTNGSLSIDNGCVWAAGSNINNSGSGNLILGAGSPAQGFQTFGNNTIITNSGTGTIQLGDGIIYNSASGATNLTLDNPGGGLFEIGNFAEGIVGTLNITNGPVTFAGSTGGNLFGNNVVLNVEAGASFNYANNPETQGGIEGAGNIIMGTAGISVTLAGNRTYTGAISGTGAFTQDVINGTLVLGGSNTYTGTTTVEAFGSVLTASAANAFSPNSFFNITSGGSLGLGGYNQSIAGLAGGNYNGSLSVAGATLTLAPALGTVRIYNSPVTGAGSIVVAGPGTQELLGLNTYTGTTSVTGGLLVENYNGLVNSSSISVASGAALQVVVDSNATSTLNLNVSGGLIKSGNGTLTFSAGNPNMNPTLLAVNGGSLVLDHTTNNTSEVGTVAALNLGSGTLSILGNATAPSSESFTSTTLTGGGQLSVISNGANVSINAGAISRAAGLGSTVNFAITNSGSGVATVATTTANGPYNILGAFATYNSSDWAVTGTGTGSMNVAPLAAASYTANAFNSSSSTTIVHSNIVSNFTAATNSYTSDIRFNASSAVALTLKGADILDDGGILVTPNVGANTSTISGTTGNTLGVPAGQDLVINQFDTKGALSIAATLANTPGTTSSSQNTYSLTSGASQTITLASPDSVTSLGLSLGELMTVGTGTGGNLNASSNATIVAINPATNSFTVATTGGNETTSSGNVLNFTPGTNVVKSGGGQLKLSGANAFKGLLVLNAGTTTVTSSSYLGSTSSGSSSLYFNGGALEVNGNISGSEGINDWIIGPGGATIQVDSGYTVTKYGNTIWGSGDITLTGPGVFDIGSDGSSFTGRIFVNAGSFQLTSNQVASATGITVASGAQYVLHDTTSGPFNIAPGASMILNGNGPAGTVTGSGFNGAFYHYLDEAGSADYAFNSPIILASTSRFVETLRANASAPGGFDSNTDIFPYAISGPGNLIKDGNGSLVLSNPNNTYGGGASGTTIISDGVLQLGVTNGVPAGSTIQFGEANIPNSGTFDLNGYNQTVQNLTVAANTGGDQEIINSSNSSTPSILTIAYNGSSPQSFSGEFGGTTTLGAAANNFGLVFSGTGTFVLSGINTYTGSTNVTSGSLVLATNSSLPAGTTLTIGAWASVVTNASAGVFVVASLSNSGVLDLNNNQLVVQTGTLAALTAQVQAGYNNGNWNGTTGIVSSAAANDSHHLTALGVIDNDNGSGVPLYGSGGTISSTFEGITPSDGNLLIKYTYYGDTDLNGEVDGTDYSRIDNAFTNNQNASNPQLTGWYNGDFNYDGVIDGSDYALIDNAFNSQGAQFTAAIATPSAVVGGTSAVPEPASLAVLGMAGLGLLSRRRRA